MKKLFKIVLFVLFALPVSSCTGEQERYETIKKLRAIGTGVEPLGITPSTADNTKTVTLTFYAALPKGGVVTAAPFVDDEGDLALPILIATIVGSETYEELAGFTLYSVRAVAGIPTGTAIKFLDQQNFARLRYGMTLTSGDEEEKIVGNILVYQEGVPELAWSNPALTLHQPTEGATLSGQQNISLSVTSANGENFRISWFVSDGKVKNRRAISTEWEPGSGGDHTIVATARGLKSGAFGLKYVNFKVE